MPIPKIFLILFAAAGGPANNLRSLPAIRKSPIKISKVQVSAPMKHTGLKTQPKLVSIPEPGPKNSSSCFI